VLAATVAVVAAAELVLATVDAAATDAVLAVAVLAAALLVAALVTGVALEVAALLEVVAVAVPPQAASRPALKRAIPPPAPRRRTLRRDIRRPDGTKVFNTATSHGSNVCIMRSCAARQHAGLKTNIGTPKRQTLPGSVRVAWGAGP